MRRLARHLFTLCSAASLAVCGAGLGLWAEAGVMKRPRRVFIGTPPSVVLGTEADAFFVYCWVGPRRGMPPTLKPGTFRDRELPGLRFRTVHAPHESYYLWMTPPLAVTAAGVLPACWAAAFVRRRRAARAARLRSGLCLACGYDVRASPGRCPECGAMREAIA